MQNVAYLGCYCLNGQFQKNFQSLVLLIKIGSGFRASPIERYLSLFIECIVLWSKGFYDFLMTDLMNLFSLSSSRLIIHNTTFQLVLRSKTVEHIAVDSSLKSAKTGREILHIKSALSHLNKS